jgi:chitosanase
MTMMKPLLAFGSNKAAGPNLCAWFDGLKEVSMREKRKAGAWRLTRLLAASGLLVWLVACGGGADSAATPASGGDLARPESKEIAMQVVSSAENSTVNWRGQYGYIEDIGDGRGYTGGIIGFTSGTGDMLALVQAYTTLEPTNGLRAYLPALQKVNGTSSHQGLGSPFVSAWKAAAQTNAFRTTQDAERDRGYFNPAVGLAKGDGLGALGQFAYFDAAVVHGLGEGSQTLEGIRATAMARAATPTQGGDEVAFLNAFLDARIAVMKNETAHEDVSRIETAQRVFLQQGNLALRPPLSWMVYGDAYSIDANGTAR